MMHSLDFLLKNLKYIIKQSVFYLKKWMRTFFFLRIAIQCHHNVGRILSNMTKYIQINYSSVLFKEIRFSQYPLFFVIMNVATVFSSVFFTFFIENYTCFEKNLLQNKFYWSIFFPYKCKFILNIDNSAV